MESEDSLWGSSLNFFTEKILPTRKAWHKHLMTQVEFYCIGPLLVSLCTSRWKVALHIGRRIVCGDNLWPFILCWEQSWTEAEKRTRVYSWKQMQRECLPSVSWKRQRKANSSEYKCFQNLVRMPPEVPWPSTGGLSLPWVNRKGQADGGSPLELL